MPSQLLIFCDGGARGNPGPAASAFVITDADGKLIYQQGKYLGIATNNQAEHNAVLLSLTWLESHLAEFPTPIQVEYFLDSQLVVNQLLGKFKIKDYKLKEITSQSQTLIRRLFTAFPLFTYIPRAQNHLADALVNQTLDLN